MLPAKVPPPVVTKVPEAPPLLAVMMPPPMPAPVAAAVLLRVLTSWTLPFRSSVPPGFTTKFAPVEPYPTAMVLVPPASFNVPWLIVVWPT